MSRLRSAIMVPEKKDALKQNTFRTVIMFTLAVLSAAMCIFGFTLFKEKPIVNGSEIAADALEAKTVYSFDNMFLFYEYAYAWEDSESSPTDHYYLVGFADEEMNVYYASLEVNHNADLMAFCEAHMEHLENGSENTVDPILKGVFESRNIESLDKDVRDEYAVAIGYIDEEVSGTDTGIHFIYKAANEATYHEANKSDAMIITVMGAVFTVICVATALLCLHLRKKIKKDLERVTSVTNVVKDPEIGTEDVISE